MSTESNASVSRAVTDTSDLLAIQAGTVNKAASGSLTVNFDRPFETVPVVVISPYYTLGQVGAPETITNVSEDSFTIDSKNQSADYYVNWIAVVVKPSYYYHADADAKVRVAKGRPASDSANA
jgi:hypothetical protein